MILALAILGAALLSAALLATGCQSNDSGGGGTGAAQAQVQASRAPTPVGSLNSSKVTDGPAPLQYNFAAGGNVRVIDKSNGKQLAQARVGPNTVVRIDPKSGVTANDTPLAKGPLPADHQYEIWMDR
jgi:hypothetical protein